MCIDKLLDNRNQELWNNLNSIHDIKVEYGSYPEYSVFTQYNTSILYVPKNEIKVASFTHELLHIYLATKDIRIGNSITTFVREEQHLRNILSENLIDHIGNCMAHIKMLPYFLKMGFKRSEFLFDYHVNKLTETEICYIKKYFLRKKLFGGKFFNKICIDLFIGKYFSAKACPNSDFDYSKVLSVLKSINPELYDVLDDFMKIWIDFEIDAEYDSIDKPSPYFTMQLNFVNNRDYVNLFL